MPRARFILSSLVLGVLAAGLIYLSLHPQLPPSPPIQPDNAVLRIGLIPERDIFQQRRAYRALADYLETRLNCHVQLQTNNTYEGMLDDFRQHQVDAAFLGSLVAALTVDRFSTEVMLKSEVEDGADGGGAGDSERRRMSTYAGVIFVPENSPAHTFADLRGRSLGAVPTTTAGAVYPVYLLQQANLDEGPRIVWTGTHDDVIREVLAGRLDGGAVKDLRLDAYERAHPEVRFRRLATSPRVPNNALVVRKGLDKELADDLRQALLGMNDDVKGGGRQVLADLGITRFLPCTIDEYGPLYDMLDAIGSRWPLLHIDGAAPRRPGAVAAPGGR